MEAWPIKALKAAPISRKLEIAQNAKSCSKQKKLPKSCLATCGKPYKVLNFQPIMVSLPNEFCCI